jgi:nitrous oxidase accessory protein NosD
LTDVNNATLTHITTRGNAWGSIAVMTDGRDFPGGSDTVTLTDITSTEPVYTEVGNDSDPASPYPLTNFTVSGFVYRWINLTDKPNYVYYTETESQATALALRYPHPDQSSVFNMTNCHYVVAPGMSIQTAVDAADPDHPSTIDITPGTHTLAGVLNLNKPVTLHGVDRPLIQVSGSGDRFDISAAGVSMDGLRIEKTDKVGEQNIIRIRASDINIVENEIFGHYVFGENDVSRAMVINAGAFSGINISGNTIHDLRQPAYISGTHTGLISNNYVYRTRGWVLEGGDLIFVDNRWGSGANANILDIAILRLMPAEVYTDIPNMALANNGAFIEDQRTSPATLSIVHVDSRAATSGTGTASSPVQTITQGIARVVPNGMLRVAAGTYVENIVINKPLNLAGAWAGGTMIKPAVSNPNPCTGSALCGGAASSVILVQANDVIIHNLIVDGDNPALTSGIVRGGADLDARNGILKNTDATYDGLEVYNTTVQNIYLRGIYSAAGTFNFHDNTVTNVQGDGASIGMFAWYGPGIMSGNKVSYANDALSANHSRGIQFVDNTVTHSGSGVHTDNAGDGGGTPDLIQSNHVSDCLPHGYGVWTFVPYIAPTVEGNTVTNCEIGLSVWGQGTAVAPQFTNNTVTGPARAAGSVGVYITTDLISWGYSDVSVNVTGNVVTGFETGIQVTADKQSRNPYPYQPKTITAAFHLNQIDGNTFAAAKGRKGTYVVDLERNWWGSSSGPSGMTGLDYTPWCGDVACSFLVGVAPEAFNKIDPANGAAELATSVTLTWSASPGATRYEYCLSTRADACTSWKNRGTQTSVSLSGLLGNTTYYWQVRAANSYGTTYADGAALWSFRTSGAPAAFGKTVPLHGASGAGTKVTLQWGTSAGATRYEYCLATSPAGCTTWITRGTQTSVSLSGLLRNTTYYWQVRATNSYGTTYADGATLWSFTTKP